MVLTQRRLVFNKALVRLWRISRKKFINSAQLNDKKKFMNVMDNLAIYQDCCKLLTSMTISRITLRKRKQSKYFCY